MIYPSFSKFFYLHPSSSMLHLAGIFPSLFLFLFLSFSLSFSMSKRPSVFSSDKSDDDEHAKCFQDHSRNESSRLKVVSSVVHTAGALSAHSFVAWEEILCFTFVSCWESPFPPGCCERETREERKKSKASNLETETETETERGKEGILNTLTEENRNIHFAMFTVALNVHRPLFICSSLNLCKWPWGRQFTWKAAVSTGKERCYRCSSSFSLSSSSSSSTFSSFSSSSSLSLPMTYAPGLKTAPWSSFSFSPLLLGVLYWTTSVYQLAVSRHSTPLVVTLF